MSQDIQFKQQLEAMANQAGGDVDVDAEHDPETSRQASNAGLRREAAVQRKANGEAGGDLQNVAARGVQGSGGQLPHMEQIQRSFGAHDVSGIQAHTGGQAAEASREMGAEAYATGTDVAFAGQPDLHTAAHEAAHVVQQRQGVQLKAKTGEAGDAYEKTADEVADRVVAGKPAGDLLGEPKASAGPAQAGAVQMKPQAKDEKKEEHHEATKQEKAKAHDDSSRDSLDAAIHSLTLFAKHLHTAGLEIRDNMNSDTSGDAGPEIAAKSIEDIYHAIYSEAIHVRIMSRSLKLDKTYGPQADSAIALVKGGWTRFEPYMNLGNSFLAKAQHEKLSTSSIETELIQLGGTWDTDYKQLGANPTAPKEDVATLKTEAINENLVAAQRAVDSVRAGNPDDGRVVIHVRHVLELAKGDRHAMKAHKAELVKLEKGLKEVEASNGALASTFAPAHAQIKELLTLTK